MQTFERSAIHEHAVGAVWPEFLGTVQPGEPFIVETERYNAVNGPVEVASVKAGDAVAIHIESIEITGPFEAQIGHPQGARKAVPLDFEEGCFYFPGQFRLKARPTVGNIAILPTPTEDVLAFSQRARDSALGWGWRQLMNVPGGKHCHQDCPWVATGATLHMKAQVDGLGLCVADVHGYQSAATMAFASMDVAARVQLRVERSQGWLVSWPLIETDDEIMVLISHSSILEHRPHPQGPDVAHEAYQALREVVAARTGCSAAEADTIVAAAMDLRHCAVRGVEKGLEELSEGTSPWDLVVVAALPKDSLRR